MHRNRIPVLALILAAFSLLAVSASFAAEVTAGEFVQAVAKIKGLPAGDAATAAQSLRAAGFAIPQLDGTAVLREKDVVEIAGSLGLAVTTSRPTAPFTTSQVDSFLAAFDSDLRPNGRSGASSDDDDDNNGQEKPRHGHRKHRHKSRCDPD